jgi:16S rRNA (guanine(527)-N(7))-methyltransferase RsmG
MQRDSSHADEFASALEKHATLYDVQLTTQAITRLREYYEMVIAWNARLHLVAPCTPEEFATRHVLESLLALSHLSEDARVVDVGSGAGLPVIPCLIVRPSLRVTLIESSQKKAIFLREALRRVGAHEEGKIIAGRFEETPAPEADYITCRALDHFIEMLPKMIEWSPQASRLLLFGGDSLREQIETLALSYNAVRIPESERRFLFIVKKESKV